MQKHKPLTWLTASSFNRCASGLSVWQFTTSPMLTYSVSKLQGFQLAHSANRQRMFLSPAVMNPSQTEDLAEIWCKVLHLTTVILHISCWLRDISI